MPAPPPDGEPVPPPERRFVWPPRKPARERDGGSAEGEGMPGVDRRRLDTTTAPAHLAQPARRTPAPPLHPFSRALREVERTWFGLITPPLHEWLAEAGWSPDDAARYCPRCGETVGPHEADDTGCPECRARRFPWSRLVRLGDYAGVMREVIHEVKFARWRRFGDQLGAMLGHAILHAARASGADLRGAALVPVPTTFRRRMARGVDHSLVIARGVRRTTGLPIMTALERSHRPSQVTIAPGERSRNLSGAVRARPGLPPRPPIVIVIDDVKTTGATLAACSKAIIRGWKGPDAEPSGVIWGAVVGVTPLPDRRAPAIRPPEQEQDARGAVKPNVLHND